MASLIAFVSIFVESPYMDDVVQALSRLDKVVDLYEVTGEFNIVTVVSTSDIEEFRDVLKNKIMKVKGDKSTVSSIVLKTHKGSGSNVDILNPTSALSSSVSHQK